jgi:hypothetical protein
MGFIISGKVGPHPAADGGAAEWRCSRDGAVVNTQAHATMYEAALRGNVFTASTAQAGITVASGNISPMSAGGTPHLALYNPWGSGKFASILRVTSVTVSGTPGAGAFSYNVGWNQIISIAGNITARCNLAGGKQATCRAISATAMTGSAACVPLRPIGKATFAGAAAVINPDLGFVDILNGEVVLPPGGLFVICIAAAGTTHVVASSITWEECDGVISM